MGEVAKKLKTNMTFAMARVNELIIVVLLFSSCGTHEQRQTPPTLSRSIPGDSSSKKAVSSEIDHSGLTYDTSLLTVQHLKRIFQVEKRNGNGIFLQLYIYLSDTAKLQEVNSYLKIRYEGQYTQALDIWYFDKKHLAKKYLAAIVDDHIADPNFEMIDKHMICIYSWAGQGDGSFDYNR